MDDTEPWCFTVIRTNGLRLMRPEKSWRPIVTVEVDKHHCHETVMGVDGQNPNLKEKFLLKQANSNTNIDIRVWHRSQSKRKNKKRNLVASASHSLGELIKRQEKESQAKVEVRLQCQTPTKRATASRGKPQSGATLLLRIHPPRGVIHIVDDIEESEENNTTYISDLEPLNTTGMDSGSSNHSDGISTAPSSPTEDFSIDDLPAQPPSTLRRRRRKRICGYTLNSDDEPCSSRSSYTEGEEEEEEEEKPFIDDHSCYSEDDSSRTFNDERGIVLSHPEHVYSISVNDDGWSPVFPALLPQYTERVEVPSGMNFFERVLSVFTMYNELRTATLDSHYENVFVRLRTEWMYVGGLLVSMAALSTAVFGIAPQSLFKVESYARNAIAASGASSGLGIAVDAWFLLRYNWADLPTFINRARDLYGSYFFFALSSRVPGFCLFISAVSLMLFLSLVAFSVWPFGVTVACFIVGLLMTLQFLVFGVHWCALRVADGARTVHRRTMWVVGSSGGGGGGGCGESEKAREGIRQEKVAE